MKKRLLTILSAFLAACMLVSAILVAAAAEKDDPLHGIVPLSGESYYPSFHSYGNLAYGHGHTVSDYLVQNSDSTLTALRPSGGQILIETYSSDGKSLIKTQKLSKELSIFGGFYAGTKYNFLVFAQNNNSHNNSTEVFRVVKYSKDWNRLGAASLRGADTEEPCHSGNLSMAESGGRLFVHTCRLKYSGHQANLTFVYDEEKNSVIESTTDDYGNSYSSHSYNQLIGVSDGYVYRLDHGDYNPRAIKLSRSSASGSVVNAGFTHVIDLSKTGAPGDNYTGVELGGFEVTDKTCVTAGAIVNYKNFDQNPDDTRNIFVAVTDKELKNTTVKMLTSYKKSSKCMAANPHLVKLGNNRLLLIWNEQKDENTLPHVTRFATIDANGNLTSSVYSNAFPLSDCKPILCRDGKVRWYAGVFYNAVGDNVEYSDYYAKASFACLYTLDPSDLAASDGIFSFFGDADKSGVTGNCMWMLNGSVLTITGSGEMDHYTAKEPAPWGNHITKVLIVSGVKKIGAYAFGDCEKLTDVAIPGSVESIGDQAFSGCASLKVIHIPDGVKSIGDYSFGGCTALESVTLPNSVERIGDYAFDYCIALESITIPNGVKSIGDFAFAGCKALKSITIPDGVKSIGDYAFDECQRLAGMVIPDSVTSIGTEAVPSQCCIYGKKGITPEQYAEKNNNIFVPIGQEVAGKSGTWSWSLDQDFVLRIKGKGKIDDVEDFDPPWGYSIRKVVIDSGITEIGEHAFAECTELTEVIISDSVTEIGMNAFCYCDELTSVTIGNGVTYIAPGTFSGCPNLKSITIPESVVDMGICGLGWYYDWNDDENPHRQVEGFTIYGYRNSEAERYADDNRFKFVDISPQSAIIPGDVDGDGTVTITDATIIQIYVADLIDFSEAQKEAADTNADEAIDITDATMIQMYVAEQIEHRNRSTTTPPPKTQALGKRRGLDYT